MQLTIDSSEPLDDVLRVVGGLFGVTLTRAVVAAGAGAGAAGPAAATGAVVAPKRSRSKAPRRRGGRTGRGVGSGPDAKVVRAWAIENGYAVNARGALSAEVRDAYAASVS